MIPFTPPKWAVWALGAVAAIVLLAGLWLTITAREEADDTRNIERGKVEQREADQAATIENMKEANNAREEIKQVGPAGDAARYAQCLRSARTPANCERYAVPQ